MSINLFSIHWCSGVIIFSRIISFLYCAILDNLDTNYK